MNDPIRIIAWGNRGRRDDGVGLVLAERLAECYAGDDEVVIQEYHQLGPELVEDLGRCRLAIFVDACVDAGVDEKVRVEPVLPVSVGGIDTHHCPPGVLLGLGEALQLSLPKAILVKIRAHDLGFGDGLSRPATDALAIAESEIAVLVASHRADCPV